MGTKKNSSKTPENQSIKQMSAIRKTELIGQLLTSFYAENEGNLPLLKQTVELMFDTYVEDNEDENERTDAVWFTQGFVNLLRNFKGKMNLQQRGALVKKYILMPLSDGNPNIVEDMFYRVVVKSEESHTVNVVVHFYRSFQRMIEGIRVLNGKPVL